MIFHMDKNIHKNYLKKNTYPLVDASSSLSDIVMTETAGDGVSCIVIVCCRLFI